MTDNSQNAKRAMALTSEGGEVVRRKAGKPSPGPDLVLIVSKGFQVDFLGRVGRRGGGEGASWVFRLGVSFMGFEAG